MNLLAKQLQNSTQIKKEMLVKETRFIVKSKYYLLEIHIMFSNNMIINNIININIKNQNKRHKIAILLIKANSTIHKLKLQNEAIQKITKLEN